jgi:hypothetical protein
VAAPGGTFGFWIADSFARAVLGAREKWETF